MGRIRNQRAIIDRRGLMARLDALDLQALPKYKRRPAALAIFKEALAAGREEAQRRFETRGMGTETVRENCFLIDQLVRVIHDFAASRVFQQGVRTTGELLSIVAVGGYGRGELSPHSDIDLLFLLPYKKTPYSEQLVEYILYMLWDMGLKVGHATRSVDECIRQARADMTIRTAMLESRWLWGDQALYRQFRHRYRAEVVEGTQEAFVEAKLAERDARHEKMGDSRYVLEPNIKEGKGGLRDLHTLYWIARYLYDIDDVRELAHRGIISRHAATRFAKAQFFLWTVRCHLHYLTDRPEDRLTFDLQPEIGRRMGYTDHAGARGVERFMKHYFLIAKDVGDLTRIFCAVLEEQNRRRPPEILSKLLFLRRQNIEGFRLDGNRLNVAGAEDFRRDPVKLIRLFHTALTHGLDIHPKALSLVTQNLKLIDNALRERPEANRLFREMLTSRKDPEFALRLMNEAGVLGRFIPDFGRVVAQMQYDMYHVYTVDEHTLQAIGILHRIEEGRLAEEAPVATEVVHKVRSREVLYLAVFLHDIAKGRGGDHSEIGAEIAMRLCPRLGLSPEDTATVAWLVRHHLLMSRTAFKRDVDDPKTIADFAVTVESLERLRLLLVLTVADIRAVGPNVWNSWKAGLLRELYLRAEDRLSGGLAVEHRGERVEAAQEALRRMLQDENWDAAAIEDHLARGYPSYWVLFDTETHLRHARMVGRAEQEGRALTIDNRILPERGATEVTIYTGDHPGLFSRIAGAMAVVGASIVDAKIVTLANGMALDTFWIQNTEGGPVEAPDKLRRLEETIERALAGRIDLEKEIRSRRSPLPSRARVFTVEPRVIIDNEASKTHTVIEVAGRDRPGLLYALTRAITDLNLQIASAHISTYGERAVDAFYVKDLFGLKVGHANKIKQIRQRLAGVLAEDAAEPAAKTAAAE